MNLEYHKGYPCVYETILCQEGYCSNCVIYLEKSWIYGWLNEEVRTKNTSKIKISKAILEDLSSKWINVEPN